MRENHGTATLNTALGYVCNKNSANAYCVNTMLALSAGTSPATLGSNCAGLMNAGVCSTTCAAGLRDLVSKVMSHLV